MTIAPGLLNSISERFTLANPVFISRSQMTMPDDLCGSDTSAIDHGRLFTGIPIIVAQEGDGYVVVDGCKRLKATAGRSGIICCIVEPMPDPIDRVLLRIALNQQRDFAIGEKIKLISWLKKHLPVQQYNQIGELVAGNARARYELECLGSAPQVLIDSVIEGTMELGVVPDALLLDEESIAAVVTIFGKLSFSLQTQREILEWLPQIAQRDQIKIAILLSSTELDQIFSGTVLNNPQKVARVRQYFYDLRYPVLSTVQRKWRDLASRSNPEPSFVRFEPSPGFERDKLVISITVTKNTDAVRIFKKIADVSAEAWGGLISPLSID